MRHITLWLLLIIVLQKANTREVFRPTGLNFGVLPAFSFDSDLGLQYGGLVNLFNYGDGKIYPGFCQMYYLEISRFTGGSGVYRFMFDSGRSLRIGRLTTDLSYTTYDASEFYGFNGFNAVVNMDWINKDSEYYLSRFFYSCRKDVFSFRNDLQGEFSNTMFRWNLAFNILKYYLAPVDIDKINRGRDPDDMVPDIEGLYEKYHRWGLISARDFDGGFVSSLKFGLIYDTRDNEPNPMKGMWSEAGIEIAASYLGTESPFSKIYFIHRQYFTLVENDLSLACRAGFQTRTGGQVPHYHQSQLLTSFIRGSAEGLGGAKSIRGVLRNRIIGDGLIYGNIELRWKPFYFDLFKQQFYIGVNAFLDFGRITDRIDYEFPSQAIMGSDHFYDYFCPGSEKMHYSAGSGIRLVMNQNFIVAADIGRSFYKQDGGTGFYMGMNYLF